MIQISDVRYCLTFITQDKFIWTLRGLKTFKYYFIVLMDK